MKSANTRLDYTPPPPPQDTGLDRVLGQRTSVFLPGLSYYRARGWPSCPGLLIILTKCLLTSALRAGRPSPSSAWLTPPQTPLPPGSSPCLITRLLFHLLLSSPLTVPVQRQPAREMSKGRGRWSPGPSAVPCPWMGGQHNALTLGELGCLRLQAPGPPLSLAVLDVCSLRPHSHCPLPQLSTAVQEAPCASLRCSSAGLPTTRDRCTELRWKQSPSPGARTTLSPAGPATTPLLILGSLGEL